jgi:fatty acid desaturase
VTAIPVRTNLLLGAAFLMANALALFVLPLTAWPNAVKFALVAIVVLTTPAHWALVHDAIHSHALPGRKINEGFGRVMAIAFGVPFRAARFAHLRHHRYNRAPTAREEVFDPKTQSRFAAYAFHFLRISIGLYAGELALCVLCFLPRAVLRRHLQSLCPAIDGISRASADAAIDDALRPASLLQIRGDALCIVLMLGTSALLFGSAWPLLATLLLGRGLIISHLDHAPHHGTPIDQRDYAFNLRAPRWLQLTLLNFNFHRTHHENPQLPWSALRARASFGDDDMSFVRAVFRQWRGPIAVDDPRVAAKR